MSLFKRFFADLRQVWTWMMALSAAIFSLALIIAWDLPFLWMEIKGAAWRTEPLVGEVSFLRSIDFDASYADEMTGRSSKLDSLFEDPSVEILLKAMAENGRMFLQLPLRDLAQGFRGSRFYAEPSLLPVNLADTQAIAIVGAAPPFLPEAPLPGKALLWGTLEPEADTYLLKGLTVRRVQKAPLGVDYVTGTAHVQGTEGRPVVAIHPEDIKKISETPLSIPRDEFFRYFTCYCDPSELAPVAADMTQASLDKGLHRAFYAIGYEGLAGGPQERSFLWGSLLGELVRFFAVLALWGLIVMGAQMYWVRRAPVYATDRFCGAPGWQLHLRLQSLILLSLILPAALGFAAFVMINPFAFDSVQLPYPLPLHLVILWALGILALLYLSAGLPVMFRMKRLIDYPVKEVADV